MDGKVSPIIDADQVKEKYIERMGKPLGELFHALWGDIALLHLEWQQYRQLYGTNPERIDILNRIAPSCFYIIKETLWNNTLLHISRLTDKVQSCGKPNLCLRQLVQILPKGSLNQEVDKLIIIAEKRAEPIRELRNQFIAHYALNLIQEHNFKLLPKTSRKLVEDVLEAIRNTMNCVEERYCQATTEYKIVIGAFGDADDLLVALNAFLETKQIEGK